MATLAFIIALCVVSGVRCYVLLSANLEDVHTLAQQVAASPVSKQFSALIRRASSIFNQELRARNDDNHRNFRTKLQPTIESAEDNQIYSRRHLNTGKDQNETKPVTNKIENLKRSQKIDDSGVTVEDNQDKGSQDHIRSNDASQEEDDHEESSKKNDTEGNRKDDSGVTVEDNKDKGSQDHILSNDASQEEDDHEQSSKKNDTEGNRKYDSGVTVEGNQDTGSQDHIRSNDASQEEDDHEESSKKNEAEGNRKDDDVTETRSRIQELVALGKNASLYLDDIKDIIEQV